LLICIKVSNEEEEEKEEEEEEEVGCITNYV
jgi:hypothetical protein